MGSKVLVNEMGHSDETIFYWCFPHDPDGTLITDEEKLSSLCSQYLAFLQPSLEDYIWYNEHFTLNVEMRPPSAFPGLKPFIGGKVVVGDYLEDEWFVFYLLVTLTKAFPNLICRVFDNDGEFPLIEAALHLPSWVDPESADQRVFLREGLLHLVPPSLLPPTPDDSASSLTSQITMAAVGTVSRLPTATLASAAVQSAVALRIEEYPRKISREHHSTHAFVPVGVAALLHEYPTLVSLAVNAFANKQPSDNKSLRMMRHFPPETRVMTSVRFSKALYAVLSSHPYTPDSRTGWNIPSKNNNAHLIGMKLACGFEILVCNAGGVTPSAMTPSEESPEENSSLDNDPQWIKYKEALKEKDYFRGELEGSKLYQELEGNARRFFVSNHSPSSLSVGSVVVKLLSKVNVDYDYFKQREKLLAPPDDEKWLEISPDAFDAMLEGKFQNGEKMHNSTNSEKDITNSLNAFLKHTSSYEGAEIPEELRPVPNRNGIDQRKKSSTSNGPRKLSSSLLSTHPQYRKISSQSNASDSSQMSSLSAKVDFNADSFTDALNNILELSLPEDEYFVGSNSDSSGMSSYEDEEGDGDVNYSRKISDSSTSSSKASSGVDPGVRAPPERPPRTKKKSSTSSKTAKKKIPLAQFEDFDDEDDDDLDEAVAVTQLLQTFKEEGGRGPTSSLLASLGINPPK